jgi:hypothetical protein
MENPNLSLAVLGEYRREGGDSWQNHHPLFLLANRCVVFVAINTTRFLVLLCVNDSPVLFCQVSIILRAHSALFPVDAGFLVFQVRCFARG